MEPHTAPLSTVYGHRRRLVHLLMRLARGCPTPPTINYELMSRSCRQGGWITCLISGVLGHSAASDLQLT